MLELFVIGTFWFWALIIGVTCFMFWLTEEGHPVSATITMIATIAVLWLCGNSTLFKNGAMFAMQKPWTVVCFILAYFGLGTGWSIVKWYFYVRERREEYYKGLAAYKAYNCDSARYGKPTIPQVKEEKDRIIGWMVHWLFSILWTLINDPVRKAFKTIYYRIASFLQRMADKAFVDVTKNSGKKEGQP